MKLNKIFYLLNEIGIKLTFFISIINYYSILDLLLLCYTHQQQI